MGVISLTETKPSLQVLQTFDRFRYTNELITFPPFTTRMPADSSAFETINTAETSSNIRPPVTDLEPPFI